MSEPIKEAEPMAPSQQQERLCSVSSGEIPLGTGRNPRNLKEWLRVGDRDQKAASRMFDAADPETWDSTIRHLHAAVEKLLKGVLSQHGFDADALRKVFRHDIERLYKEACRAEPKLIGFEHQVRNLAYIAYESEQGVAGCTVSAETGYDPYTYPANPDEAGFFKLYPDLRELVLPLYSID